MSERTKAKQMLFKYVLSYNMQDEIRLLFKGILRLFWIAGTGGLLKLQSSAQPSFKYT